MATLDSDRALLERQLIARLSDANTSEHSRALSGIRQALAAYDGGRQRLDTCQDPKLRQVMQSVYRRQAEHSRRLLAWLAKTPMPSPLSQAPMIQTDADAVNTTSTTPAAAGERQLAVIEKRLIGSDFVIFKLPRPSDFTFTAGQYVKLRLKKIQRSYSLVSAPHEPYLEFFIELLPGSRLAAHWQQLAEGDIVQLSDGPKGSLTLDRRWPNQLMIATVTGVNPFISILRDYLYSDQTGQRFILLHGASFQDEFGYRDELTRLAAAHPNRLVYLSTVSRPDDARNQSWTGLKGRVNDQVADTLARYSLTPADTLLYACGHPGMVDEVDSRWSGQGFTIKTERY